MRLNRRRRRLGRAALLAAGAAAVLSVLVPTPAPALGAAPSGGSAVVSLYAGNAGTESAGESVTVTIGLDNESSASVGPGTATLSITEKPLADRTELDAWVKQGGDGPATRVIGTVSTPGVTAGTSQRVATLTLPAEAVGLGGDTAVYGIEAVVADSSGTVGTGRSSLTYVGGAAQRQVGLAVAMPITVPPTSDGLISPDDLLTYTAPDGLLTRQLEIARNHSQIAIAIDPMIIASIRVLGTSAPQSARGWLDQLSLLPNDSFPLQYGDADPALQLQSGLTSLLQPSSFGYALDPKDFATPLDVGETPQPTPTPTTNPFVTPTPTATQQPNVPTLQQLLSWPYTFSGIAWPADNSLRTEDLETLAANGFPSTIVSGSNTNAASLSATADPPLPIKGGTALVTDQGVSTALRKVIAATDTDEENAAMASVSAQLAEISRQSGDGTVILAGLGRDWPASSSEANRALNAIYALPWVSAASLRAAENAPATSGLRVTDASPDAGRVQQTHALLADASGMDAFATVLTDPTLLTGHTRNQLLSLLAVAWSLPDNNWPAAVADFDKQASDTVGSVKIVPTGKITVASAQSLIPVTVTNGFELPVNIVLRATPSNGRLEVDSDTPKSIPAKASAKVLVPVKAKLGNGSVKLGLQLYSPTGLSIGGAQTAAVEVHADWEGLGALILGIAVVLFFGFGVTRSIVRRVKGRGRGDTADDDPPGPADHAGQGSAGSAERVGTPEPEADGGAPRG